MERKLFLLFIALALLVSVQTTDASTYNLEVGAVGDSGSIGSIAVRAEIRTHIYHVNPPDTDSFWVANNLDNGAGIQFGYYLLAAGVYCLKGEVEAGTSFACASGSDTVNGSEALWFWAYWPSITGNRYYFGLGPGGSVGLNGTWHVYSIIPNSQGQWNFLLDGQRIANASFLSTRSSSKAYFAAEKGTFSTTPGPLGPVEFRNLAYLKEDGWHNVSALHAIVNCGVNPTCIPIPYGVSSLGPNHIIAGTSVSQPKDGELLWNSAIASTQTSHLESTTTPWRPILPTSPEVLSGGLVAVVTILLIIEFIVLPRRKHTKGAA